MPIPIPAIAAMILGGGLAAKEITGRAREKRELSSELSVMEAENRYKAMEDARVDDRLGMIFNRLMIGGGQQQPTTGAQQPTTAPSVEAPQGEAAPTPDAMPELPAHARPGEISDVPILPTKQLLTDSQANMFAKGMSINAATGNVNIQVGRDTAALNAEWFNIFQRTRSQLKEANPNTLPIALDEQAIESVVASTKRLPSQQVIALLNPERRMELSEATYRKAVRKLYESDEVRKAVAGAAQKGGLKLSHQAIKAATLHYALRAVSVDMGGYMPEEEHNRIVNMEGPPVSATTAQKAFQLFGISDPRDITQQQAIQASEAANKEKGAVAGMVRQAQTLGAEAAAQQIFEEEQGTGPISREVSRKERVGEVDLALADRRPVSSQLAESLQVPAGTTMGEVKKMGLIEVPPWVQKNRASVWDAIDQLENLKGMATKLITAKPQFFSILKQAYDLKTGRFTGKDVDARVYESMRQGLLSVMARNVASERGVLNEGDIKRAERITVGDFSSADEMQQKLGSMLELLNKRLGNAEKAALPRKTKNKATKRYNRKTGKFEVIK